MNEDMTKIYRSSLAFEARQLKRDQQIADTWTRDGHILIKNKTGNIKSISTKQELSLLMKLAASLNNKIGYITLMATCISDSRHTKICECHYYKVAKLLHVDLTFMRMCSVA